MLTKSQLKELFARHDFRPLKRLGENYLIDGNIKDKIVGASRLAKDDVVLEIGPGLGALTLDLASSGAQVFAVEKDRKAFAILKKMAKDDYPNLELVNRDILEFDMKAVSRSGKIKVIGSLPYYITTPIIEYLIENRSLVGSVLVVIQKEVARRLTASPGTKDYSSISCLVQFYTRPSYVYTIKRTSFYPSPEVDSALLRLDVPDRPSVSVNDEGLFFRIIRGAFNQRRKSVINSLSRKAVLGLPKERLRDILNRAGIDPASRPENLSLLDFARLANVIK